MTENDYIQAQLGEARDALAVCEEKLGIDPTVHDPRSTEELLQLCEDMLNGSVIQGECTAHTHTDRSRSTEEVLLECERILSPTDQ